MTNLKQAIYLSVIAASAIGAMEAIKQLGLNTLIQKNPLIALVIFALLIGYAGRISEKLG